jgi:hypothetical protein
MRVNQIQVSLQFSACQIIPITNEVSINIIRVVFVFGERTVSKHVSDADLPELVGS